MKVLVNYLEAENVGSCIRALHFGPRSLNFGVLGPIRTSDIFVILIQNDRHILQSSEMLSADVISQEDKNLLR